MASREQTVSAAEFVRQFGVWRERASRDPIYVTHHGRSSHVLMAIERFEGLADEAPHGSHADPLTASLLAVADRVTQGILVIGPDLIVRFVNRCACDQLMLRHELAIDRPLNEVMPRLRESPFYRNLMRALRQGEHSRMEVSSPEAESVWFEVEAMAVPAGAALLFRNITEEVRIRHSGETRRALIRAIEKHGAIGQARLTPRGGFEDANGTLREMVGLSAQALARARFVDIVSLRDRPAFNTAFEQIFHAADPEPLDCALISNSGGDIPVRLSLVALQGDYAPEGAIALVTPV